MLEALIFDVDGTVAETEDLHRRAFNLAFDLHEVELAWDPGEYRRMLRVHGGKERIVAALAVLGTHRPLEEVAAIHASKTRFYAMLLASGRARWRPGVRRLMDEARQAGLGVALATTTTDANLEPLFAAVLGPGWRARFAAIVAGDMVPRKKPAPDVYVEALRRLRVGADSAVAFEDSAAGVAAARGAGLAVIATPSAWLADDDLSGAELVLDHLGDAGRLWDECHPQLRSRWLSADALAAWHGQREAACSTRA
jgi:HAD superfamily hydrolase (TIGR01509 family)